MKNVGQKAAASNPVTGSSALVRSLTLHVDGWDVTVAGDEERVGAFQVAERGGMKRSRVVKELIDRNRAELEKHGEIHMRRTVRRISKPRGGVELREVDEPMLNEAQAYNLVALMRTERASELRVALVQLFVAVRRGNAPPPAAADAPSVCVAKIGQNDEGKARLRRAVTVLRAFHPEYTVQRIYGYLRSQYSVSTPFAILMRHIEDVERALKALEGRGVALIPARQVKLLAARRALDARQAAFAGKGWN